MVAHYVEIYSAVQVSDTTGDDSSNAGLKKNSKWYNTNRYEDYKFCR